MNAEAAKAYLNKAVINLAFKKEEIKALNIISQRDIDWTMDFKELSMDNVFLESFVTLFEETFKAYPELQICGMESGALPFLAALRLRSPRCKNAFYIRKSAKKSDLAKIFEGKILEDVPILIIDDLINRGNTVRKQLAVLEESGHKAIGGFFVLSYRDKEEYTKNLGESFSVRSIFSLDDFSPTLGLKNLKESSNSGLKNDVWKGVWRIKLSQHNPYHVVPKSGPVLHAEHIYMGADDGYMRSIDKTTGKVIWQTPVLFGEGGKRIFSTPAVSRGRLFFGAYDGNLYCLDTVTGKRRWVFMEGDWIGSSPCVSADRKIVYIGLEFGLFNKHGGVAAVDTATGNLRWAYYEMSGLTHASPAVSKKLGVVVCGCNDHFVYCLNAKDGRLLWKFKTGDEVKYGATFDEKRGLVIISSMDGKTYCLKVASGEIYASFSAKAGFYSTPVMVRDCVIVGSLDKSIYCFDIKTKEQKWSFLTRGRIFSSPVLFENSVYIGSNDGVVYELDQDSGNVESAIQLTNRVVNRVVIQRENGRKVVYVPTDACELLKFEQT